MSGEPVKLTKTRGLAHSAAASAAGVLAAVAIAAGAPAAHAVNGTYYVDCSAATAGSGTLSSPWNSLSQANTPVFEDGDHVLFKAGTTCTGTFAPKGSGGAGAGQQIVAGSYGSGANPVIDGNGALAAVHLLDVGYWTVENLHLRNPSTTTARRNGVLVESTTAANKGQINLTGLAVEDVAGWGNKTGTNASWFSLSAGIMVYAPSSSGHYEGINITGNTVTDTGGGGIKISGDTTSGYNTGVYIGHNVIRNAGGDGIVVHNADTPLIEYNEAYDLGSGKYPFVAGNFAGMWPYNSNNPTFQHNIVGGSRPSTYDSTAWDCDISVKGTCTYQYNYSFGNAGGFYLDCLSGCGSATTTTSVVLRYNIAQGDCRFAGASGGPGRTAVYNNTFYCNNRALLDDMTAPKDFTNNIIVAPSATWNTSNPTNDSNSYFGGLSAPAGATNSLTDDPRLVAPGSGQESLALDGYKLTSGSSALSSGAVVTNNGGKDFFGNPVSATAVPNRGAYQGVGITPTALPVASLLNNVAVTSDANPSTGAVSWGSGRSYSSTSLATAGLVPGSSKSVGGFSFTWHPTATGRPDSIKAAGQTVAIGKSGTALGFIGFATSNAPAVPGTINYTDGTTQSFNLGLSDWWAGTPSFGNVLVSRADYQNQRASAYNGSIAAAYNVPASVWLSSISVDPNKKVKSVVLPAGSAMATTGLNLFDIQVK